LDVDICAAPRDSASYCAHPERCAHERPHPDDHNNLKQGAKAEEDAIKKEKHRVTEGKRGSTRSRAASSTRLPDVNSVPARHE
jgi:hypothetical protein